MITVFGVSDLLSPHRDATWDLAGLVATARGLLERTEARSGDERVSALPDERTVRYYQTSGLVDRPLRYDGRTAVYGYRHLLQVVTVKLLQAQGQTLAQVQRSLAGLSTAALEGAVSPSLGAPVPAPPPAGPRSLIATEVAPGVTILIDPAEAGNPDSILEKILKALSGGLR
jgi:DNA-binding transcriptional MerR regulator